MKRPTFIPYSQYIEYPVEEMKSRTSAFYQEMRRRRTIREFSDRSVPIDIIEDCIRAASTAPSGANQQPWKFVVVQDPNVKRQIRIGAEEQEREFYEHRAPKEWLDALSVFGTDEHKPFLQTAPYLIVIFEERYHVDEDGKRIKHYYPAESVGLAAGLLIAPLHHAGLATLTHTPQPMNFLNKILDRPRNEKPFMLIVVGYPSERVMVPLLTKKPLEEIMIVK